MSIFAHVSHHTKCEAPYASGLRVVETPMGRVGGLICWENYMPLARFAVFAQGCEVYIAPTWDAGSTWTSTMRHIAAEGRCWVLGNGTAMRGKDIPKDFPKRAQLFPDLEAWYNPGDSVIVDPRGELVAGPLHEEHGWILAGAWETAMRNESEVFLLWAIPSWEQWASFEQAERADTAIRTPLIVVM